MFPTPPSSSSPSSSYRNYGQQHTPVPPPLTTGQQASTPLPFPMPISSAPIAAQPSYEISRQQTMPQPVAITQATGDLAEKLAGPDPVILAAERRKLMQRFVAVGLLLALLIALFFTWNAATPTTSPTSNTQNFTSNPAPSNNSSAPGSTSSGNTITVYVVGAVKHPGVYSLPADARIYQLLQAAGGPLSNANLVALNLAAKLSDGEEVYVVHIGETPPTYYGGVPQPGSGTSNTTGNTQLININTASADEMRQALHISSTTAQAIINYRTQNGPFTSVDQLQQVVSQSIYDKIKNEVTV